jgi:hypothetical protein
MMPIVDSGTSHKHVAFLKDKSNVSTIAAFEEYRVMAERQTGHQIKRVRTDGAFDSGAWGAYFKSHGILHEPTTPYSSSENGLAEHAICTITEDICTLLADSGLPHKYWAAAGEFAVETRNLMPSHHHPGKIPQETFTGRGQSVAHLRVFGSKCSAKVNTTHSGHRVDGKSKINGRSIPATLIGYASGASNYILIDENGVQFESRNVEFDEGMPHRTLDVGERLWMEEDTLVDSVPPNSAQGNVPDAPGINPPDESIQSPALDEIDSTPTSHTHSPDPKPAPAPPPELRRSSRNIITTTRAAESLDSVQREDTARAKREDWATQSARPRARANAAWDPMISLNAQLDDSIAQTLMSYNPDRFYTPKTYTKAMQLDPARWTAATDVEIAIHDKKNTWVLEKPPPGANIMASKWVFDVKKDGEGNWLRDKARLVGKGFT